MPLSSHATEPYLRMFGITCSHMQHPVVSFLCLIHLFFSLFAVRLLIRLINAFVLKFGAINLLVCMF
jgi:hypothetical protein